MRWFASVLLVLALAGCGGSSPHKTASPPSPTSPAPTTAPASPTRAPCPYYDRGGGNCVGPLKPGTYTSDFFQPPVTYTVPRGWDNTEDLHGNFVLLPPGGSINGIDPGTSDFIGVFSTVAAPNGCNEGTAPGVATTAAALTAWLIHDPALVVTAKHNVKLGRLSGVVMDLAASPRAKPCPYSNGQPVAPFIVGVGSSRLDQNVGPGQRARLYVLANGEDALAIEVADVHGGRNLDTLSAVAQTMTFGS